MSSYSAHPQAESFGAFGHVAAGGVALAAMTAGKQFVQDCWSVGEQRRADRVAAAWTKRVSTADRAVIRAAAVNDALLAELKIARQRITDLEAAVRVRDETIRAITA